MKLCFFAAQFCKNKYNQREIQFCGISQGNMPDCTKCKLAVRGETGIRCAGVCDRIYHSATKCSGLDQYSVGVLGSNPMVIFMCEDCRQYIHNVDLVIRDIQHVVQQNDLRFKDYKNEFDSSLKQYEKEMKSFLVDVEDRFKARVKLLKTTEKTCTECVSKMQNLCQSADAVVENTKKSQLESEKLIRESAGIKNDLEKLSKTLNITIPKANSFAQVLKSSSNCPTVVPPIKKQVPLIIKPKEKQTSSESRRDLTKNVDPCNFKFSNVQVRQNGDILISTENEKEREKIRKELSCKIGDSYEIKTPEMLLPRVMVSGMSEKMEENKFLDAVKKQNLELGINYLKLVRYFEVRKNEKSHFNAIIEVNTEAFSKIINIGKMNIGWERCRVFDGTRVLCCFKCKGFNHRMVDCSEKEVCLNCLGEHRTDSCNLAPVNKCINCIRSNTKLNLSLDVNHATMDKSCPGYIHHLEQKKKKIGY